MVFDSHSCYAYEYGLDVLFSRTSTDLGGGYGLGFGVETLVLLCIWVHGPLLGVAAGEGAKHDGTEDIHDGCNVEYCLPLLRTLKHNKNENHF